ncbi:MULTISPECIES: CaiB/BaiF CoA-transferase family protein [unclassified Bacillus (in: firmicutes)]|uniref:CaiB/BaiF CoA transferase family protein n=1 Tax=unclassified Bacillus (in: firmicutes) TaxID=185979 RepID=UPI001BE866EC|nr:MULTISPECIES: CaiB/BaiF CoA-transferase family protein [unclassified Bacillus (in: firmicutes)]MBT2617235.1 CoA transferase [Bacillus sp. ISL-78]MBT2627830.1 CoA transferase [Bacillus sp. ISL-101]
MKPLQGLKVLDLSRILSGPYCTMILADMGADVIKIEAPQGDDTRTWGPPFIGTESCYFLSVNRNKKSLVLNLKTSEGKAIFLDLVKSADIVVENFRPGTIDKLGISYNVMKEINEKIILASISGFGQTGPYAKRPGYDVIAQGMGGLMSVTGEPDGTPMKAGFSFADLGSGMWALIGILMALQARNRTGKGQWVDASLLDTMISWQTYLATGFFATGINPQPMGSAHPSICPYQVFQANDGYFNVGVGNETHWKKFCQILKLNIANEPRFSTNSKRVENRDQLIPILENRFKEESFKYWVEILDAVGIPAGPVYQLSDLYADPHVSEREMLLSLQHPTLGEIKQVGIPIKLSDTPGELKTPPPLLGEHSNEILQELGYNEEDIIKLYNNGVSGGKNPIFQNSKK